MEYLERFYKIWTFWLLKVVCNEMKEGPHPYVFNYYWSGAYVIVFGLNFFGDVVF